MHSDTQNITHRACKNVYLKYRLKIRMSNHSRLAKGGEPLAMSGSYRIRRTIPCNEGPQVTNSN